MIVIHYPMAYKALDNYVDCFNSKADKSNQKLKTATVAAAKEIIRIYGASLLGKNDWPPAGPKEIPPLRTNNQQLAVCIKCSPSSVKRYIRRLWDAGIITEKKFRGTKADYDLWMNPDILLTEKSSHESRC